MHEKLHEIRTALANNEAVPRITVRDLLTWFGAKRRGIWVVANIRKTLALAGLRTEPDIETVWIGTELDFLPYHSDDAESEGAVDIPWGVDDDPTYRISKLATACQSPMSVAPDTAVTEVVTMMLTHNFSQIPVVDEGDIIRGIITWQSLAARFIFTGTATTAGEVMNKPVRIAGDSSIFKALPIVADHGYVLVEDREDHLYGIVTVSDIATQFRKLSEPLLLLGEIDNHIRRIILKLYNYNEEELRGMLEQRAFPQFIDLTFEHYIELLSDDVIWQRSDTGIGRKSFLASLRRTRDIRDQIIRIDPDCSIEEEVVDLRSFAGLLRLLRRYEEED
ncbi:MAG: CBS domain-containing protein [Bacteroidetes bacterium]|nr:CBS domain-containing protein [Bacteroidota bacterium]